jgi:hypothetical protein
MRVIACQWVQMEKRCLEKSAMYGVAMKRHDNDTRCGRSGEGAQKCVESAGAGWVGWGKAYFLNVLVDGTVV